MVRNYDYVKLPDGYGKTQYDEDTRKATAFIMAMERGDKERALEELMDEGTRAAFERMAAYVERVGTA